MKHGERNEEEKALDDFEKEEWDRVRMKGRNRGGRGGGGEEYLARGLGRR